MEKYLKDRTQVFVLKCFKNFVQYHTVNKEEQPGKGGSSANIVGHINKLITLAFTAVSSASNPLKKVGFSLIIELVKKFRYTEELVDEEDEETLRELQKDKDLLIEQYEAQINSIIRQSLTAQVWPDILIKSYSLIYYFISVPISKDPDTIGKIIGMLTKNLSQLSNEYYERAQSEIQLKKLSLLCKLYLVSLKSELPVLDKIEINKANLNSEKDLARVLLADKELKLKPADKERIRELLKPGFVNLRKHICAAIEDACVVLTMPRTSVRLYNNFNFIQSGTRSAYNLARVENSLQYFLKTFGHMLREDEVTAAMDQSELDRCVDVSLSLLYYYLSKSPGAEAEGERKGKGDEGKRGQ